MTAHPVVLADDLSGAAETAAGLGAGSRVLLWRKGARWPGTEAIGPDVPTVMDLGTRAMSAECAAASVRSVLEGLRHRPPVILKKIDSLLRGHGPYELCPFLPEATILLCPALPEQGRTIVDGRLLLDGAASPARDAWTAEPTAPPQSLLTWMAPLRPVARGLDEVRAGLGSIIRGEVSVCDAETDHDLATIAAAARRYPPTVLAGSSALIRAYAAIERGSLGPEPVFVRPEARPCLVIVGTASSSAQDQAKRLSASGLVRDLFLDRGQVLAGRPGILDELSAHLAGGHHVMLRWQSTRAGERPPADRAALSRALAASVAGPVRESGADLVLTGGQTARTVLESVGIDDLAIVDTVEPGSALCLASDGRLVCTRPGSFGDDDSLIRMARAVVERRRPHERGHIT